jgi:hypothetical protein
MSDLEEAVLKTIKVVAGAYNEELEKLQARITEAPRAWAVKSRGKIEAWMVFPDADILRQRWEHSFSEDYELVPIALVELKPEEVK